MTMSLIYMNNRYILTYIKTMINFCIYFYYFTRPIPNNTTKEKIQKIVEEVTEEKSTECSNTNKIYQNIPKETHLQKKYGQSHFF